MGATSWHIFLFWFLNLEIYFHLSIFQESHHYVQKPSRHTKFSQQLNQDIVVLSIEGFGKIHSHCHDSMYIFYILIVRYEVDKIYQIMTDSFPSAHHIGPSQYVAADILAAKSSRTSQKVCWRMGLKRLFWFGAHFQAEGFSLGVNHIPPSTCLATLQSVQCFWIFCSRVQTVLAQTLDGES